MCVENLNDISNLTLALVLHFSRVSTIAGKMGGALISNSQNTKRELNNLSENKRLLMFCRLYSSLNTMKKHLCLLIDQPKGA